MNNSREITVSIGNYAPIVLNSAAKTFGELKDELNDKIQQGNYSSSLKDLDLDGYAGAEGNSYLQLENNSTALPTTVERDGQQTDSLLIIMYPSQNKNKFGASRAECYAYIKKHGLQETVKNALGVNYTNASTSSLENFINEENKVEEEEGDYTDYFDMPAGPYTQIILNLVNTLEQKGILAHEESYEILSGKEAQAEENATYSDSDIEKAKAQLRAISRI